MKTRLALPFLIAALSLTSACAPKHRSDAPSREELKEGTTVEMEEPIAPTVEITTEQGVDQDGSTITDEDSSEGAGDDETDDETDDENADEQDEEAKAEKLKVARADVAASLPKGSNEKATASQDSGAEEILTEEQDEFDIAVESAETGANEQVLPNNIEDGISPDQIDFQTSEVVNIEVTVEEMAAKRKAARGKAVKRKPVARRATGKAKGRKVVRRAPARPAAPAVARSRITFGTATGSSAAPKTNEATRFAPASITKLATTGMALEKLGHDFAFHHKIAWRFAQGSKATATNLTWIGEGDPTLGHPRFEADPMGALKKMAQALKQKGIKSIQGPITLRPADGRMKGWFVANGVPEWEPFTCYGAPPRAFNIFRNCASAKSGMRDTETRAKQAFVSALKSQGISVNESAKPAAAPQVLAVTFSSASLPRLLYWMNKPSDNLIAESLFKAVSRQSQGQNLQANGQSIYKNTIATWMTQMGVGAYASELSFLDGSGLTPNNVVTPRAFVQMLKRYIPKNYFADVWQSLPIAGVDGTLARRASNPLIRGKVRAKTGTLNGSYQLAGYIPRLAADGKTVKELVPFAILTKAPGNDAGRRAAHVYQDEILVDLMRKVNGK